MAYPGPVNPDQYNYQTQVVFGGLNHRRTAGEYSHRLANQSYRMDWYEAVNLTADYYPVLASRPPHCFLDEIEDFNGMIGGDDVYVAAGTKLYRLDKTAEDDRLVEISGVTLTDTPKKMTRLGNKIIIFPDKICVTENYVNGAVLNWTVSRLDPSVEWTNGPIFFSGTYEGEPATANCIYATTDWASAFRIGDAVEISGCSIHPENNMTVVIRDIKTGTYINSELQTKQYAILYFYDNTFTFGDAETTTIKTEDGEVTVPGYREHGTQEQYVKIARNVPDLDFIFTHENRIWGAGKDPETSHDMIWASALGNPEVWYNFDTTGLEAWRVDVLDEGDFTGGCSFLGYPIFFKDNHIYKIYGSIPSEFRVVGSADLGVEPGSGDSLAIAGEKLFYLSRAGVMCYTGALPQVISSPFGDIKLRNAVGGSDGLKYYISAANTYTEADSGPTYIYDTQTGIWHTEQNHYISFAWSDHGLYAIKEAYHPTPPPQTLTFIGREDDCPPGGEWEDLAIYAETFNLTEASPLRKWVGAPLEVRIEMDDDADFYFEYKYGDNDWERLGPCYTTDAAKTAERGVTGPVSVVTPGTRSYILPQIPRRTDHYRIGLRGHGRIWIYSIAPKTEQGSSWHGINGGD